ncbi:MAG TPA: TonB-dependent receptor [Sphingobacteriaceae bacterium]|nr:TonB-dependent receptor [Sphingobacteriaceae bacterium]
MKIIRLYRLFPLLFVYNAPVVNGQVVDTLFVDKELEPVQIIAYFSNQPILGLTAAAQTITTAQIESQQSTTLLPAMNTVPGIRMEERSPGSYRLAIRGSLIRSPFGVRNVKVYVDEFPLTDAGGNTYINLLDPASIASIHILKGPDGSLYGANSGGVVRIQPKGFNVNNNQGSLLLGGGSFGLFQEQLSVQRRVSDSYSFSIDQSFTHSDGYRENSQLEKKTFQTAHKWRYSKNNELRMLVLYSDLGYSTPGGLTRDQMLQNPRMARPASGPNPSAREQKAAIYNQTFFGGIAHQAKFGNNLTHSASVFGMYTDFENPFITNYEFRKERNIGIRTYFSYKSNFSEHGNWEMQLGFEGQSGWNSIENFDNEGGTPKAPQAFDDLNNAQYSFFYRARVKLYERWIIEGSLGLNSSIIEYNSRYPEIPDPEGEITFGDIWMPRVAASYILADGLALRASISKGFSPPTIAEVRSSDNIINTELEPETGVNYEIGARWESATRRYIVDLGFYNYTMKNGIVRQLRESGAEYYVNAGEIKQNGVEASVFAFLLPFQTDRFVQYISLRSAVSYHHYRFGTYKVDGNDYSQNKVTAVPDWVWTNSLSFDFPMEFGLNVIHNFTSEIPLNDANTLFSGKYHLVQLKGSWNWNMNRHLQLQLFAGIDNLFNETYSLGNDINAFGNRFFNPAPTRNYYGGLKMVF